MLNRSNLTPETQTSYLVQWLKEYSEVEKEDFLQALLDLYAPGQLALGFHIAPLQSGNKLPTLFDVRLELFKAWYDGWNQEERDELLTRMKETDEEFVMRFEKSKETPNGEKVLDEFWLNQLENEENGKVENGHAEVSEFPSMERSSQSVDEDTVAEPAIVAPQIQADQPDLRVLEDEPQNGIGEPEEEPQLEEANGVAEDFGMLAVQDERM